MADKLKVGVIGTGFGQKVHIPGFQEHSGTQVVAIAASRLANAREAAEAHEIPFSTADYRELIAHPEVQAVSIATPPHLHAEMALAAIDAGKPVLIEKPLADSLAAALAIRELAAERRVPGIVDFEFRFVPAWMLMKRMIADDYLGRLRFVSVSWLVDSLADPDARRFTWINQSELGGGTLRSLGSHVFDYLEWFFGEIVEATGFLGIGVPRRTMPGSRRKAVVTAEDTVSADLRFAGGLHAAVEVCTVGWHRYGHRIIAFGDQGTLELRQESPSDYIHQASLRAGRAGDPTLELVPIPEDLELRREFPDGRLAPFIQMIDALIRAIGGAPHPGDPDLDCGLRAQRIIDAVSRSNAEGGRVATHRRRERSGTV